jgi:hypothetical protein
MCPCGLEVQDAYNDSNGDHLFTLLRSRRRLLSVAEVQPPLLGVRHSRQGGDQRGPMDQEA